jgi:hypothetical protein
MIGWFLRLFGIGGDKQPDGARPGAGPAVRKPTGSPSQTLTSEQFKAARRRVVLYIARARIPVRQAATARQVWIADLSNVYEAIRTSPTAMILERAGDVGMKHEEAFRDALSLAQAIDPPPETEDVHQALVNWLTNLHSACLALMDARRLKDRAMLGTFRERLGEARRHAAALAQARNQLFVDYHLRIDPTIRKKRPDGSEAGASEPAPVQLTRQPVPIRSARVAAAARRARPGTRRPPPPHSRHATG